MKWEYASADSYLIEQLEAETGLDRFLLRILVNRDITDAKEIREFVGDDKILYDPFLLTDMDKAVDRINSALDNKEKIAVFGDYDADGITATMLVYTFLKKAGAEVVYELPRRDDTGYGMNSDTVEKFSAEGVRLVITVDTGITAFDETSLFAQKGIDVVITDHHEPRETLPKACAVIDPHRKDCDYPFKPLAGVGVAFKLLCALCGADMSDRLLGAYSDMIALGTIADLMPVTGENRYLIKQGLKKLNTFPNDGIAALIEASAGRDKKLTLSTVAYVLAPRINAAGRVSSPIRALKLLLSSGQTEAMEYAKLLCDDNTYRRELESRIFAQSVCEIESNEDIRDSDIIVVTGENWHQGVIGIVAAKLVEKYGKPVIIFTSDGTIAQGSGRSANGFNILDAIASCSDMLLKFGGHGFAAGLQVASERVGEFSERINAYAAQFRSNCNEDVLLIDSGVTLSAVNIALAKSIERLEPYGAGNRTPIFSVSNTTVLSVVPVGGDRHLRVTVTDGTGKASIMLFGKTQSDFPYTIGDRIDIAFSLSVNVWHGREQPSVSAVDMRASSVYFKADPSLKYYGNTDIDRSMLPVRRDFVSVYKYIENVGSSINIYDIYTLSSHINEQCGGMTALKLRLILDVFNELGIISADFCEPSKVSLKVNSLRSKVELSSAPTAGRYKMEL